MIVKLTPEHLAYAEGYFQCYIDERADDDRDALDKWFQHGEVDFNLYSEDGWAVVDAYPTVEGNTVTSSPLRILDERYYGNEV